MVSGADMLPDDLSAEDEQRCRRLLAGATARYRARPAAAAVLVPLCLVRGAPALLYTLRSSRLAGKHRGDVRSCDLLKASQQLETETEASLALAATTTAGPQQPREHLPSLYTLLYPPPFSFPGGKCDPEDRDVVDTALRETQEELGLAVQEEQVWGILRPLHDQQKATVVPVLAGVGPLDPLSLRPNPEEVDEVFALPLAHLLQVQNQGYTNFCQGGHFSYTLPVFLHGPHRVWGLTATITELALQLLAPGTYQPRLASAKPPAG